MMACIGLRMPTSSPPHSHLARFLGVTIVNFSTSHTLPETRIMGLSDGVHFTILLSLCWAQYWRVMDRHVTVSKTVLCIASCG